EAVILVQVNIAVLIGDDAGSRSLIEGDSGRAGLMHALYFREPLLLLRNGVVREEAFFRDRVQRDAVRGDALGVIIGKVCPPAPDGLLLGLHQTAVKYAGKEEECAK